MEQVLVRGVSKAMVATSLCRVSPHNLPRRRRGQAQKQSDDSKNNKIYSEINDGKWEDYSLCRRQTLSVSYNVISFNPRNPHFTDRKVEAQRK